MHLPSPDKKKSSSLMLNIFSYHKTDTWLKFMVATEDTCIQRLQIDKDMSLEGLNLPSRFSPVNMWHNFFMVLTLSFPPVPTSTKN